MPRTVVGEFDVSFERLSGAGKVGLTSSGRLGGRRVEIPCSSLYSER